jgi:hypothetical protein
MTSQQSATAVSADEMATVFKRLAINDSQLTPKPFNGERMDPSTMQKWINYFEDYAKFRQLDDTTKLDLFKLLMKEQAAEWLESLQPTIRDDYTSLLVEFKRRFALTALQRERRLASMWQRKQRPDESVDAFVTAIKNIAKQVDIDDEKLIRIAITTGLKPAIRMHVNQSGAISLNDVIKAARVAEDAQDDAGVDSLARMVAVLVDQQQNHQPIQQDANMQATFKNMLNELSREVDRKIDNKFKSADYSPSERRATSSSPSRDRYRPRDDNGQRNQDHRSPSRDRRQHLSDQQPHHRQQQHQRSPTPYRRDKSYGCQQENRSSGPHQQRTDRDQSREHQQTTACGNCGTTKHQKGQCIAYNATCYNCNKRGHFARVCRSRKQPCNNSH